MYPTMNPTLELSSLGNETVVFAPSTDQTHSLAPVAAAVLKACDGTRDVAALVAVAREVDPTVDETQLWGLLDHFRSAGLLDTVAAPSAALTPSVGRRGWMRSMVGGGAAVAASMLVAQTASAKKKDKKKKKCEEDEVASPTKGESIGQAVDSILDHERQATLSREHDYKQGTADKRKALVDKIAGPSEMRRKLGQEQHRKRQHLLLDGADGTAAWLALGSGPVLQVTMASGSGSLLPTGSTAVPLTLKLATVFDEAAADDAAARADLAKSNAELEAEIKKQGEKASKDLLAAEQETKKALAEPGVSAAAHAEDMKQVAELIAGSAYSPQPVTLGLGAQALVVGDLEVTGGETESISTDASGRSTADLVRLLVRLPEGAKPMLIGSGEVSETLDQSAIAGELCCDVGFHFVSNMTISGNLDVGGF